MNPISQDSSVTSSEESRIIRESHGVFADKTNHLVDSSSIDSVSSPLKYDVETSQNSNDSKLTKSFPWIAEFSKLCQAEIGLTKIHSLENLMTEYIRHVSISAPECHRKPNRAAKLKKAMNGTLLLFHLFYSEIKKPLEHSSYLDKMSDLMAIYIDMEITASSRSKESLFKIASKLTSSLFIFLDRSHDHILDSIFKTKCINKNWELCNLIFSRVLRESPGRAVCDLTYVRYVLAFKMWQRVVKGVDEKKNIMKLAVMKLHPPTLFRESVRAGIFSGILPKIPKSKHDITMFLMKAPFCIKEKIKAFLKQVTTTEKRTSLSSYLTNFDRIPFSSNSNDTDDSRVSSEEDQEENRGGSAALINNIWSSMSGDSGVAHQIRMANIIKGKKQKNSCKKAKCKGIATPVFKTNNQTCDSAEKLKKKRRLQQTELAAIKPLPSSMITDKCASQSNVTVVRPRMETPAESAVQESNVESCQSPTMMSIKNEPAESENNVESSKNNERVDTVDSAFHTVSSTFGCSEAKPKFKTPAQLKECPITRPPVDNPAAPLTIDRTTEDSTVTIAKSKEEFRNDRSSPAQVTSQSSQTPTDPNQEFIKKTVERIQGCGRSFDKNQSNSNKFQTGSVKVPKPPTDQQQEQNVKAESEAVQEKCKGMLHDQTLMRDFNTFTRQQMFRSNLLNNSLSHEVTVPSPDFNGGTEENSKRCICVQCSANHTALKTNFKTLTQYMESKQMDSGNSTSEILDKIQDTDPTSCLPFKKRKTLSAEEPSCGTRDDEVSYPGTPMISIAMIDPNVQSLASNGTSLFPPAIDYSVSSSSTSLNYYKQPNSFVVSNTEQVVVPAEPVTVTVPAQQPVTVASNLPSVAHSFKPEFKTPAQLKECPASRPPVEGLVAQIIESPITKKKLSNLQPCPPNISTHKKSKPKVKVDRNLRKRKY